MNQKYLIRIKIPLPNTLTNRNKETSHYAENRSRPVRYLIRQSDSAYGNRKLTYPAAGVTATSPATAPLQNAMIENLPALFVRRPALSFLNVAM